MLQRRKTRNHQAQVWITTLTPIIVALIGMVTALVAR
jgi:hypothetical protein